MRPKRSTAAWPTAFATASVLRPVATIAFPAARAALAKSTPIPRPAPVTNQTFFSVMLQLLHCNLLSACGHDYSASSDVGAQAATNTTARMSTSIGGHFKRVRSPAVLLIANLFHPISGLAIELFHNRDMCHGCSWCSSMPMLLAWWRPDYITRPNLLDRCSPTLDETGAGRHDECLAERMTVPGCPSTELESDTSHTRACRIRCLEQGVNANIA